MQANNITIEEFADGIAFSVNNKEIAFYSNITKRINYQENAYDDWKCVDCAAIPLEDNLFIMNEIKKYLEKEKNNEETN